MQMEPEQVRAWRAKHKLSRRDLAEILGVHWMTVTAWEVGKQKPPKYLRYALRGIEEEMKSSHKSTPKLKLVP